MNESAIRLRMSRKSKIIRPIQFDPGRLERRRQRNLASKRRRQIAENHTWWAVLRLLPSPQECAWLFEVAQPMNDNHIGKAQRKSLAALPRDEALVSDETRGEQLIP